jgi:hypothetical protein
MTMKILSFALLEFPPSVAAFGGTVVAVAAETLVGDVYSATCVACALVADDIE